MRKKVFGYDGVLGSFSAKIAAARAFGLIGPETQKELDLIREIRNVFAHAQIHVSFRTEQIIEVCKMLKFVDFQKSLIPHRYLRLLDEEEYQIADSKTYAKTRFVV